MAVFNIMLNNVFVPWDTVSPETELVLDSYGSLEAANIYFDNRLRNAAWKEATMHERKAAMAEATELIDRLNFAGSKTADLQDRQFPRSGDAVVPEDVQKACYEIALKLLDGYDPQMEIDNISATAQSYSTVRTGYDRAFVPEHIRAGVPSSKAWEYLKPYLADARVLNINRLS